MSDADRQSAEEVRRRVRYLLGATLSRSWDADQQVGWAGIMEVARVLPAKHDREMQAEHGLSLSLLSLLGRLDFSEGEAILARDLARDLHLSPGRISRHLATLETAGLLARSGNAEDGRALDVHLTDPGRRKLTEARRTAIEMVERDFLSLLSPEEIAVLARAAAKILGPLGDA